MALPLQPELRPRHPIWGRLGALLLLSAVVLGLGFAQEGGPAPRVLLNNGETRNNYSRQVSLAIDAAKERVWVMVYVLRPGREDTGPVRDLIAALVRAKERGVDVRIVLDASRKYKSKDLDEKHLEADEFLGTYGIKPIIDDLKQRSHAKTVLIDTNVAIVGSHNWTWSALSVNREASVMTYDEEVVTTLEELFAGLEGFPEK